MEDSLLGKGIIIGMFIGIVACLFGVAVEGALSGEPPALENRMMRVDASCDGVGQLGFTFWMDQEGLKTRDMVSYNAEENALRKMTVSVVELR